MKPLWFVEKDAFGWTINCRFMLGGKKAGVAHVITHIEREHANDTAAYIFGVIRYLSARRDGFIAEYAQEAV